MRGKNTKFVSYANQSPRWFIKTNTTTRPTRETKRVDRKIQFVDLLPRARTSSESNDNNNALKRYARSRKFPPKKKNRPCFYVRFVGGGGNVCARLRPAHGIRCTMHRCTRHVIIIIITPQTCVRCRVGI